MVSRIIRIVIVLVTFAAIVGNLSSQGLMSDAVQKIEASVVTLAYSGEFPQIQQIVKDFLHLREIRTFDESKEYADKLDAKINNLELVKKYCQQKISTHELSFDQYPYEKIQQICPVLKNFSFTKAIELFSLI